jgi:hypothetical protein
MKPNALLLACLVRFFALSGTAQNSPEPVAGWNVSYTLISPTSTNTSRQLLFMSYSNGTGTFRIIGLRTTTTTQTIFPAVYDWVTPDFISFTSEVELPLGNCCREAGTLIFKGNRSNTGVISGPVIFVVSMPIATTPLPYVIRTGNFVATPIPIVAAASDPTQ